MLFHPAILGLLLGSFLISAMLLYSAYYGVQILRNWNIRNGSELQLNLERRTYLISTLITYAFGFQLLSLFLFVYTADRLAPLFVGAMCAAGSLNANQWGYPTIILKILNFILAGLWLVLNFTDNRAYDYPLIRIKYALLILIAPFIFTETGFQTAYFLGLAPNIITSCCGTLFTSDASGVTSGIIALPYFPVAVAFYSSLFVTFALGIYSYYEGRWGYLFSLTNVFTFLACIAGLMSFISLYFYELPTHHCPFCLLQKEYMFVGYPLYLAFLGGAVSGLSVGVVAPFRRIGSLRETVPTVQRKLTVVSLSAYGVALVIVLYGITFSNLSLVG